jgi:RimJ/RimL family protein N-acetyltransferase
VLRVALAPERRGRGLMTEAVQAILDAAFLLSDAEIVAASARVLDPGFRRVLEKCGFSYCGTGLDDAPDGAGLVASDRFRLDRKTWTSLKLWRVPALLRRQTPAEDAASFACPIG